MHGHSSDFLGLPETKWLESGVFYFFAVIYKQQNERPHSAYLRERELLRPILELFFRILRLSYSFCLEYPWQRWTNWINIIFCKLDRLNVKYSCRSCRYSLNFLYCLGCERLSALWTNCLFGCIVIGRSFALRSFGWSFLCRSFSCYEFFRENLSLISSDVWGK